ncbi:MAG: AAA family ATPase, partial [Saprospiraceae bacterium]|nr:AAA family ATPase [Saprospiraceae bacterium]
MRLQRLEIKGFKSFALETVINFNEDVIGVVGPNGAGKSNLVDAIRWVLGEQKGKELRLEKMSDVIFNGTKKKKAGGVAYVSLTFENTKNLLPTEYQTVSIARYLYRSGESEYRLNNVPCRLKDIRSLFLDTGIGSNSYAIIALGMVEDILSDKENARRRMFEQAAGISKYKARKKETLNKLTNTQNDLDRIEDLLYEIEQNLKALEKQAKRTQKYFDLKERYRELSIKLAVVKIKDLKDKYQLLTSRIDHEGDVYRQVEVDLRETEAALEKLKQHHLDKEKSLSEFQRSMNDLVNGIRTAENDKKILEQKSEFLSQSILTLEHRMQSNQQRIAELDKEDLDHLAN